MFANMAPIYKLRKKIELTIRPKVKIALKQSKCVPPELNIDFAYSSSIYSISNP